MAASGGSKKQRDYQAQYQRRQEAARRAGYASYWEWRKAKWGPDPRDGTPERHGRPYARRVAERDARRAHQVELGAA